MTNHIFISNTQHIFNVWNKGLKETIEFTTPYLGSKCRFTTDDDDLAAIIRETEFYKRGTITEYTEEIQDPVDTTNHNDKEEEVQQTPMWAMGSMTHATESEKETQDAEAESPQPKAQEETLFQLKIEDVDNYMDAKAYLRDTLGVSKDEISTKDKMISYCKEHGVVFPNYEMK